MKAVHVVARICDEASGPTYSVTSLCDSLADESVTTSLHVTYSAGQSPKNYQIHSSGSVKLTGNLDYSPSFRRSLAMDVCDADILHNHGLWMMPNVYCGTVARSARCKLVCSPRGTMATWAWNRSRWKKRLIWFVGQKKLLEQCDCFHATAEIEYEEIRQRGYRQPVAIIPNGVDLPEMQGRSRRPTVDGTRTLLYLSRIHPKKGLDILLRVWKRLQSSFPTWTLNVVGTGTARDLKSFHRDAESLQLQRFMFRGPAYGREKSAAYFGADLYVLPSHTENFGMTVAEALAHGLPVVTTRNTPWHDLPQQSAGWCIDLNEDELARTLVTAMSKSCEELQLFGLNGRKWMETTFTWPVISRQMRETYQWLTAGGQPPECVRCD